jgi:DinB family protein
MTSARATALADEFAGANEAAITFARSCSDDQWRTVVPGEDWPVGVVLHHIAQGHAQGVSWLTTMVAGESVTDTDEDIDAHNLTHAEQYAGVGVAETVALLEENGRKVETFIRQLGDEDLDRTAPFGPAEGQAFPVEQLVAASYRHALSHLAHAQEAVAG